MSDLSDKPTLSAPDETDEIEVEDLEARESDAETVVGVMAATWPPARAVVRAG